MNIRWMVWAEMVIGFWILVSPWILGYAKVTSALWNGVAAGVLLMLLSLWQLVGTEEHGER